MWLQIFDWLWFRALDSCWRNWLLDCRPHSLFFLFQGIS
jgi:hypothetical protein